MQLVMLQSNRQTMPQAGRQITARHFAESRHFAEFTVLVDAAMAPFSDDTSRSPDTAFAKIQPRVRVSALAADLIAGE